MQNSAGLPHEAEKLLRSDLQALDTNQPGLSEAILSYVLDGQNEEILLHLGGLKDAASLLRLRYDEFRSGGKKGRPAMRRAFFKQGATIPPIVLHRLGRVYEVMWDAAQGQWHWPHLTKDERWLEALLCEILEISGYYTGKFLMKRLLNTRQKAFRRPLPHSPFFQAFQVLHPSSFLFQDASGQQKQAENYLRRYLW